MALKAFPFDPAKHLGSPVAQAEYLTAVLETGDISFIDSLGVVVHAHGMSQLAATGLRRESLFKALSSEGNPRVRHDHESQPSIGHPAFGWVAHVEARLGRDMSKQDLILDFR